ncbi:MAG: hypothetical protein ACKOKB_08750 [Bacteroidota bacterium]
MKKLAILACSSLLFIACSSEGDKNPPATDSIPAINEQATDQVSVSLPDSIASNTASATTGGVKLNPPHGEPGHRCEIEVGKPLPADGSVPSTPGTATISTPNSAPAITPVPNQPVTVSTSPTPAPAPAAKTATAPGMNPPHGEPGHDCAIPVGSPLKK